MRSRRWTTQPFSLKWQAVGSSIDKAVGELLAEAGLPPAPRPWPPSHAKLARVIHQAMIENQRRLANRMHGHSRFTLNPQFAGLSAATDVQPVATNRALTLSQLIARYESDPVRPKPTGKTRLRTGTPFPAPCRSDSVFRMQASPRWKSYAGARADAYAGSTTTFVLTGVRS
jgi:hypothetical protein